MDETFQSLLDRFVARATDLRYGSKAPDVQEQLINIENTLQTMLEKLRDAEQRTIGYR